MSDHIHKHVLYLHYYASDGTTFIHAKCECGDRIDEPEIRRRIYATQALSAEDARMLPTKDKRTIIDKMHRYADILEGLDDT